MQSFKIIPILGLKTSVPQNDPSLFQHIADGVALTHDVGGVNVDYKRKFNACTKSWGYSQWSNSATSEATKCMGLFELYDGANRNHIYFDNGKVYYYDTGVDPVEITASPAVTFANDDIDLYSIIRVGSYVVWADRAEHTPYKWQSGDANSSKLIASGTEYKFRYLESFQRRVIGCYSDQTDGDIELRYSTAWPSTAITSLNYPAENQLFIPNDDPIVGIKTLGKDRCFVFGNNSIHSLDYVATYSTPFRLRNVNSNHGCVNHHCVVSLGDRMFLYNSEYGFCIFTGSQLQPISQAIEIDLQNMNTNYLPQIVGVYVPLTREICWAVPLSGGAANSHLLFYNIDTGMWRKEDRAMRYVDQWRMYDNYTWNDFIAELGGGSATWPAAPARWGDYTLHKERLVYSNEDGQLYYSFGEDAGGSNIDGHRIEPVLDFGSSERREIVCEIWFGINAIGAYSIDVYYRSGDTLGELDLQSWTSIGSVSCNSPSDPVIYPQGLNAKRLHQIKWGTDLKDEKFEVNYIILKYETGDKY